jgi:hypothetical protein
MRVTSAIGVSKGVDHRTFASVGDGAGPATGVITLPHASVTLGGVGAVASAGQFTVEDPSAGKVKSGISIVYV